MKTAVNQQNSPAFGKHNKFVKTPVFQVINDVGSSVRWISGQMVTLEYGEHASYVEKVEDWKDRAQQSIAFQQRFDALNDDVELAVALDLELENFKSDFLQPLLGKLAKIDLEPNEAAEAV